MTKTELEIIRGLKSRGYAIVLITPEELKGVNPDKVEDNLIAESWEIIECLQDEEA